MKKKILLVLLLITMIFVVTSCGSQNSPAQEEGNNQKVESSQRDADRDAIDFTNFDTMDIYGQEVNQEIFQDYQLTMVNVWGTF